MGEQSPVSFYTSLKHNPMNISINIMLNKINTHLVRLIEREPSQSLEADAYYAVFKNWTCLDNVKRDIILSGTEIFESYHLINNLENNMPSWIKRQKNPEDFTMRLFLRLN